MYFQYVELGTPVLGWVGMSALVWIWIAKGCEYLALLHTSLRSDFYCARYLRHPHCVCETCHSSSSRRGIVSIFLRRCRGYVAMGPTSGWFPQVSADRWPWSEEWDDHTVVSAGSVTLVSQHHPLSSPRRAEFSRSSRQQDGQVELDCGESGPAGDLHP